MSPKIRAPCPFRLESQSTSRTGPCFLLRYSSLYISPNAFFLVKLAGRNASAMSHLRRRPNATQVTVVPVSMEFVRISSRLGEASHVLLSSFRTTFLEEHWDRAYSRVAACDDSTDTSASPVRPVRSDHCISAPCTRGLKVVSPRLLGYLGSSPFTPIYALY
jgi:hypothetical protein